MFIVIKHWSLLLNYYILWSLGFGLSFYVEIFTWFLRSFLFICWFNASDALIVTAIRSKHKDCHHCHLQFLSFVHHLNFLFSFSLWEIYAVTVFMFPFFMCFSPCHVVLPLLLSLGYLPLHLVMYCFLFPFLSKLRYLLSLHVLFFFFLWFCCSNLIEASYSSISFMSNVIFISVGVFYCRSWVFFSFIIFSSFGYCCYQFLSVNSLFTPVFFPFFIVFFHSILHCLLPFCGSTAYRLGICINMTKVRIIKDWCFW